MTTLTIPQEPLVKFKDIKKAGWSRVKRKDLVSAWTLTRWHKRGVIKNGRRVKLLALRISRSLATTESWYMEFLRQRTEAESAQAPSPTVVSSSQSRQEADAILDMAGI